MPNKVSMQSLHSTTELFFTCTLIANIVPYGFLPWVFTTCHCDYSHSKQDKRKILIHDISNVLIVRYTF